MMVWGWVALFCAFVATEGVEVEVIALERVVSPRVIRVTIAYNVSDVPLPDDDVQIRAKIDDHVIGSRRDGWDWFEHEVHMPQQGPLVVTVEVVHTNRTVLGTGHSAWWTQGASIGHDTRFDGVDESEPITMPWLAKYSPPSVDPGTPLSVLTTEESLQDMSTRARSGVVDDVENVFDEKLATMIEGGKVNLSDWGRGGLEAGAWRVERVVEGELIHIVIPIKDSADTVWRLIRSLRRQTYVSFRAVVVDDASEDDTVDRLVTEIAQDPRFVVVEQPTELRALANIFAGVEVSRPSDEEIVVVMDGDDWFYNEDALSRLVTLYADTGCWFTYGSFVLYPDATQSECHTFPEFVVSQRAYRSFPRWFATGLRTFKAKAFRSLPKDDMRYSGAATMFPAAYDAALSLPLLELVGHRAQCVPTPLFFYNVATPYNDQKVRGHEQREVRGYVGSLPSLAPLPSARQPNRFPAVCHLVHPDNGSLVDKTFSIRVRLSHFFPPTDGRWVISLGGSDVANGTTTLDSRRVTTVLSGSQVLRCRLEDHEGQAQAVEDRLIIVSES